MSVLPLPGSFPAQREGAAGPLEEAPAAGLEGSARLPRAALPRFGPRKSNPARPAHCKLAEGTMLSCLQVPGEGAHPFKVSTGLSPPQLSPRHRAAPAQQVEVSGEGGTPVTRCVV